MAQLMPLPLSLVSVKSRLVLPFWYWVVPVKGSLNGCVCVCVESKSAALVAAVSVDIPKNICNFLHKNKLNIIRRVQFLTGRRSMRSFSPGAIATIA